MTTIGGMTLYGRTMRREKAKELELKGNVAVGSSKLAGDKGRDRVCEEVQIEGKNMCKGEGTLRYHRKMWSWEWK